MDRVLEIIRKKHPFYLYVSLAYLVFVMVLKWWLVWNIPSVLFLAGGVIGIYFLDMAEAFFKLSPSPFRSVLFAGGMVIVAVFVLTSSASTVAHGLVLTVYLTLMLWMVGEWRIRGSTDSWYQMVAGGVMNRTQRLVLYLFLAVFVLLSLFYLRS